MNTPICSTTLAKDFCHHCNLFLNIELENDYQKVEDIKEQGLPSVKLRVIFFGSTHLEFAKSSNFKGGLKRLFHISSAHYNKGQFKNCPISHDLKDNNPKWCYKSSNRAGYLK